MGLHIAILQAAARGHRPRHKNARAVRRLRPIRPSHKAELAYKAQLLRLVGHVRTLVEHELRELKGQWPAPAVADGIARDALSSEADWLVHRVKGKLGGLDDFAKRLAGIAAVQNRDGVDDRLIAEIRRAIGVDVSNLLRSNGQLLQSMQKAVEANVALIKSVPGQYLDRVHETVTAGWSSGIRWESLVEQIQRDGDITENRAKLIARDQTAKLNSAFNQERQQQVGIERYEWSTSEDERVRPEHAAMETLDVGFGPGVFSWADPPLKDSSGGEPCHPGEDIQCRCVAIPVVDMEALELSAGIAEQEQEQAA